ncbi:winged helix-turn-helix transcriptional regulator [Candidatus Pacearchaeota archaeon]|nr:MAG: winged helix-turn-helix transcriptional regulator [Candidatus Pacearchaeota archaeon]
MVKDFDIIDLDDEKTKKFAEAVKNPTSKKILALLRKGAYSQKDISKKLGIPMPTVHYSLERLISSGLVEVADYYWSPKGNKVYLYRASKKVMVFTPEKSPKLIANLKMVLSVAVVLIAVLALVAIYQPSEKGVSKTSPNIGFQSKFSKHGSLKRFSSEKELLDSISKLGGNRYYASGGPAGSPIALRESAESGAMGSGLDFSKTNVQVKGVDEADFVKTDGKNIFVISNGKLKIVKAQPPRDAKILSTIDFGKNFYPEELFIEGGRLLVFGSRYFENMARLLDSKGLGALPSSISINSGSFVFVRLYDISDPENPKLLKETEFEGTYLASRKVDGYAYFVINTPALLLEKSKCRDLVPLFAEKNSNVEKSDLAPIGRCTDIGYVLPEPSSSFITFASISLNDENEKVQKETILGDANEIYASKNSFYIAQTKYPAYPTNPPMMADSQDENLGRPVKINESSAVLEGPKTIVSKFSFIKGKINFVEAVEIEGSLLNQFSMDEFGGNFRIVTTVSKGTIGNEKISNRLYVFDENLKELGRLENLAPGEMLYSARFMGERAYLVTFKEIDPLFVIDLSKPESPRVLGRLKIPGFSNYLHPIDDTHIIGIGKEVDEKVDADKASDNAVYYTAVKGLKISIFDVSDVSHPKEMFKKVYGDRGTESIALTDHRAFLFDKKKELLVLPIQIAKIEKQRSEFGDYEVMKTAFNGAYVFNINLKDGIVLKGNVSHSNLKNREFYDYGESILRSLYINDVLYTISNSFVQLNNLENLKLIKRIEISKGEKMLYAGGGLVESTTVSMKP